MVDTAPVPHTSTNYATDIVHEVGVSVAYIEFANDRHVVRASLNADGRFVVTIKKNGVRGKLELEKSGTADSVEVAEFFEEVVGAEYCRASIPAQPRYWDAGGYVESGANCDGNWVSFRRTILPERVEPFIIGFVERRIAKLVGLDNLCSDSPFQ